MIACIVRTYNKYINYTRFNQEHDTPEAVQQRYEHWYSHFMVVCGTVSVANPKSMNHN